MRPLYRIAPHLKIQWLESNSKKAAGFCPQLLEMPDPDKPQVRERKIRQKCLKTRCAGLILEKTRGA
jgi:hypothetical protein